MSDWGRTLITFLAGAVVALIGSVVNHVLSARRWEVERRDREVADLYQWADKYFSFSMEYGESRAPTLANALPHDSNQVTSDAISNLKRIGALGDEVRSGIRRAPEPLTDHARLFNDRMHRAANAIPYDIELAKFAFREFRAALDEYVRRGRTRGPKLLDSDAAAEYERGVGVFRFR